MNQIRIGIIGAGGISCGHARRLRQHPEIELAALAEPSKNSLKRFAANVCPGEGLPPVYKDHRAMLDNEQLDAALITSPHTVHFDQIMDCLDKGLHVLTEKPMVCSLDEANKVVAKSKATRKHVVVSYQRRFQGPFRYIKRFIHAPEFGKIFSVASFLSQGWLEQQAGTWRHDPKFSGGGQLNDSGSHLVDMIMWMLDDQIDQVSAVIDNRGTKVDVDSAIAFRTKGGTIGTLTIVGSGPTQFFWEDMTITGESGRSIFLRKGTVTATLGHGREVVSFEKFGPDSDPDTHFLKVIQDGERNESPPEDFLNVVKFTEAAWESAAKGGIPIRLQ